MSTAINSIKLPVGRSGVNNRDDVKVVQQLLNRVIAAGNQKVAEARVDSVS